MLVLTRKTNEKIVIADEITVTVLRIKGGRIQIGIDAPSSVPIRRRELAPVEDACLPAVTTQLAASQLTAD